MKNFALTILTLTYVGFTMPADKCSPKTQTMQEPSVSNAVTKELGQVSDGPYVLYSDERVVAKYIATNNGTPVVVTDSTSIAEKSNLVLKVNTDEAGKTFTVKLKDQLQKEKSEYKKVNRLFAISDIEGNFQAFRKLLQGNQIVDQDFNWTYGDGHLVLTGDFVDRGDQVTEVLWLVYALESKAKAAGGYVHFILGNHEIMNMSGDLRYLHKKYADNANLLNERFTSLYGDNSELGRWLRTKNVAEKIGDVLFIHGGISAQVNQLDLPAAQINDLVRPFYPDSLYKYSDPRVELLFSDLGPFWYRGYYTGGNKAGLSQIDSTLDLFRVKHIATGHTIIADTITSLFNGKVFNTDLQHAKGISEALLLENGKFYRVNNAGLRSPLN